MKDTGNGKDDKNKSVVSVAGMGLRKELDRIITMESEESWRMIDMFLIFITECGFMGEELANT